MAIVLGHEITHAVAGHGRERMSQQMLAQGIQDAAGNAALGSNPKTVSIFNFRYTGQPLKSAFLLPYSRKQESEADHYGLIFAAMAGYNPQEAIPFWTPYGIFRRGEKPPEFLSDHPADQQRIDDLKKVMPEASKIL